MDVPTTDFMTREQLKASVRGPSVGVRYSGAGKVMDFSANGIGDLGKLDAAFGAAASGVRNANRPVNILKNAEAVRAKEGSAVVISNGEASLKGEESGDQKKPSRIFSTDNMGKVGWNDVNSIDAPGRGACVGKTLNVEASSDSSSVSPGSASPPWSFETSRTVYKIEEDGSIGFYNYFRTFFVTRFGRIVGMSSEREVCVGKIEASKYSAKPVVDGSGNVTAIQFGTSSQLSSGNPSATLDVATIGKYGVKPVYSSGLLSALNFGTAKQLDAGLHESTVSTTTTCPYAT